MINTETKTHLISHDVGGSLRHLHRILISLPGAAASTQPMSKSESKKHDVVAQSSVLKPRFQPTAEQRLISVAAGVPSGKTPAAAQTCSLGLFVILTGLWVEAQTYRSWSVYIA